MAPGLASRAAFMRAEILRRRDRESNAINQNKKLLFYYKIITYFSNFVQSFIVETSQPLIYFFK